jgi:hypothetical protein
MGIKEYAEWALIIIFTLTIAFHFLVVFKIIPYNMVWGGRVQSLKQMYRFEVVSILLNIVFLIALLIIANIVKVAIPKTATTITLWVMLFVFTLNTIGNLLSKNKIEKIIFTPITAIISILTAILCLY